MTTPNTKKWEEEFDKNFLIPKGWFSDIDLDEAVNGRFFTNPKLPIQVKDFIRNLLSQSRQEFADILTKKEEHYKLREKLVIEEVKKDFAEKLLERLSTQPIDVESITSFSGEHWKIGYNLALQEVKNLLKQKDD